MDDVVGVEERRASSIRSVVVRLRLETAVEPARPYDVFFLGPRAAQKSSAHVASRCEVQHAAVVGAIAFGDPPRCLLRLLASDGHLGLLESLCSTATRDQSF